MSATAAQNAIAVVGIDIGKNSFHIVALDDRGAIVLRGPTVLAPHGNAPLQEEGANLIDDAGALADQAFAHPMESLQVELFGGLGRHKLHRGALDRLSDCLRVAEVVLLSLGIWPYVLRSEVVA